MRVSGKRGTTEAEELQAASDRKAWRDQIDAQRRERVESDAADAAEFYRKTRIRADEGARQIRQRFGVLSRAGLRDPVGEVCAATRDLGRPLSLWEMWIALEPTEQEVELAGDGVVRVRDLLPKPQQVRPTPSREEQLNAAKKAGMI